MRLIDADALTERMYKLLYEPNYTLQPWNTDILHCIETAPTVALPKEQEPVKPVNVHMYSKMFVNVRSGYCPICNNPVDEEEGNNFCCSCGRRLNWND